jgi:Tol biopolymer transport system component
VTTGVGEYAEVELAADGRTMIGSLVEFRQTLTVLTTTLPSQSEAITDGSTGDFDPVMSPDGERLVFSSARSGFQNLWTSRPDGTMPRALTSGNAFDERPAFSPNGRELAFVSDRGGKRSIWTMPADGGIPEHVIDIDVIDQIVWSPDASRIVFAITAGDAPVLQSVRVADAVVETVRTPGPATSPIGFVGDALGYLEPFAGDADRPNATRVAFVGPDGQVVPHVAIRGLNLANGFAAVSPDGRRIAGVVEPGGAGGSIWVAELAGDTPFEKVADFPADTRVRGITWFGDRLIAGTYQRTSHLVLFDQAE